MEAYTRWYHFLDRLAKVGGGLAGMFSMELSADFYPRTGSVLLLARSRVAPLPELVEAWNRTRYPQALLGLDGRLWFRDVIYLPAEWLKPEPPREAREYLRDAVARFDSQVFEGFHFIVGELGRRRMHPSMTDSLAPL